MEPLERGSGVVIDTQCSEDVLDKNWQRLIITHLLERDHRGVLTGAPITDIKITLASRTGTSEAYRRWRLPSGDIPCSKTGASYGTECFIRAIL